MELETGIPPPSRPWQMEKQGLRAWPRVTESPAVAQRDPERVSCRPEATRRGHFTSSKHLRTGPWCGALIYRGGN